jgi:hypothetical protein
MSEQKERDNESVLYLMQVYKPWAFEEDSATDVFYDPLEKRIIFLKEVHAYIFEQFNTNKDNNPVYYQLPTK